MKSKFVLIFSIVTGFTYPMASAQIITNGLVAYYPFNGNANDESGNGNNGTPLFGASLDTDRFGNANSAYSFDGIDDMIEIQDACSFQFTTALTLSVWIFQPVVGTLEGRFIDKESATTGNGFQLDNYGSSSGGAGQFHKARFVGHGSNWNGANTAYTINAWHHLVVSYQSGIYKYYTDGVFDGTVNDGSTTLYLNSLTVRIGASHGLPRYFNGKIDDIYIFNRALTAAEATALFNQPPNPPVPSGLIACYPLDNNTNDYSGNNYNGTGYNLTSAADRFGNPNHAYHFSGTGSYIQLPTTGFILNEFTYSVWCKPANIPAAGSLPSNYYSLIAIGGQSADQSILLGNDPSPGHVGFGSSSYTSTLQSYSCYTHALPSVNTWYHVVMTRCNCLTKFYVNGVLVCSISNGNQTAGYLNTISATIGSRLNSSLQLFQGDIDDVRIYDRVLSQTEIQNMPADCACTITANLGSDTSVCIGNSFLLNAGNSGTDYSWYFNNNLLPGDTNQTYSPLSSGTYSVDITNGACNAKDTIIIRINPKPSITVSSDTSICEGLTTKLTASGASIYQWAPTLNLTSASGATVGASPISTTTYTVTGIDSNNCRSIDSIKISVTQFNSIPIDNVFTPDGDGKNDGYSLESIENFEMKIFNRWGQPLITLTPSNREWDGTYKNHQVPEGLYFYLFNGPDCKGEMYSQQGTITIIR